MLKNLKTRLIIVVFLSFALTVSSIMPLSVNAETSSDTVKSTKASIETDESNGKFSIDVRNADIRDVLSAIAVTMGYNIIYIESPILISFSMTDVSAADALDYLLKTYGMDYIKEESTLVVGQPEKLTSYFSNSLSLTKITLKYIQSDVIASMIDSLGIQVKKVTLDTNKNAIWVQGLPTALGKVRELVNMIDRAENASDEQLTRNIKLTSLTLTYITAKQMNEILQMMGLIKGIVIDTNPNTLWVYTDSRTLSEINDIKAQVDVPNNAHHDSLILVEKKMKFLTAGEIIPILAQLGVNVNPITFPRKSMTIWLNGTEESIKMATSMIDAFDVKENMNDNVFFIQKLTNITAKEAENRLKQLDIEGIKTYTFAFPEFAKSIMVFCPSDYKLFVMSHINKLDVKTERIKVPIDYSDVATGMSRLQYRRDVIANLTGVTTAAFTITTNIARDDGFHYIMYLEESPETIQMVKDMIKYIDDPHSEGSSN